jgi:hypothetical protein
MDITRDLIIEKFRLRFSGHSAVYALWLEGADSTQAVDEFSDIDLWLDVADGQEAAIFQEVERLLTEIGPLDFNHKLNHSHPKIHHTVYHLQNSSEFLRLDVNLQSHSRPPEESEFVTGDLIESPQVIFDKAGVIRFVPLDEIELQRRLLARLIDLEQTFSHLGVRKYVARNDFLEALAYYHRYVLQPLVELLRIRYTPLHHDYGPVHISRHLPRPVVMALEELYQVASLAEMIAGAYRAEHLFKETLEVVKSKG